MKKTILALLCSIILCSGIAMISPEANAAINWGTSVYISNYGQVVNSITYNGVTVNSVYAPRNQVSNYDEDTTFCCAAFVKKFYSQVYGIGVNNLYPGRTPNVYSGSGFFYKTSSPAVGDIAASSGHWAIVKEVSGNTVTLVEQNAWNTEYTHATVNRKIILPESSYWFWRYSLRDDSTTTSKVDLGNNFYGAIINTERDKALTVETNNNNNIAIYTYLGRPNQIWYFTKNNDGSYKIVNCSNGQALDVYNGVTSGWANVWTCDSNDTSAQKWNFYGSSPYMFITPECNSCVLDVADAKYDDGTNICINTKTGHNAQLFKVVKVDAPCVMTTPTITLNKTSYKVGERVNISWEKTSSDTDFYQYWVVIENPNGVIIYSTATGDAGDVDKNSFSFNADLIGAYKVNVWSVPYNNKEQRQKYSSIIANVECNHTFSNYISDNNASYVKDGTKTAHCDNGCGKTNTIVEKGSKLKLGKTSKLTATPKSNEIKLTWKAVSGADGYRVYQYDYTKKKSDRLATITGTSYTIRNLKANTKYRFSVKAYSLIDGEKVWSDSYTIIETQTCPGVTNKITSVSTTTTIKLTWNKVSGATGYRVYRYNATEKKWVIVVNETTKTTATIKFKTGAKTKFAVKSYKKLGDGTILWSSSYKTIETATKTATPKISKLTSSSKGKAVITWTNVSGENGFQVYYSTKKDGDLKKYSNYKGNTTKATVSKLKSGKTYYFKVRTYKSTGSGYVYSSWSQVKSVKIK